MEILFGLIKEIWITFQNASFYILLGIFFAGLIYVFINKSKIARHLGQSRFQSVLLAALFGIPLPLCSCGVVPTAMALRKGGASKGATLSFLISTPETGVDSIAISYALLDPLMTIFRPIAALVTALVAGIVENVFDKKDAVSLEKNYELTCEICHKAISPAEPHRHPFQERFIYGMRFAFVDLLGDIAKWFILGIVIAGIIAYFIPESFILNYLREGWPAMLLMLAIGIPMYICASASTPIAAALILKGMSPGVALVFLLTGPATNAATILIVSKFLGKRAAVIYLISIALCAIMLGLLLNQLYATLGIDISATFGHACEIIPHPIKTIAAIVLIVLTIHALSQKKY